MPFVRVRSAGGPNHEFSVGVEEYQAHPDLYDIVDDTPSEVSLPAYYPDLEAAVEPPRSGKGSGEKAWREYAESVGVDTAELGSKDEVIAAVDAAKNPGPVEQSGPPETLGGESVEQHVGENTPKENQ